LKLELENISFSYIPGKMILEEFSASFEPGIVYALAGANGAGKSTLAKIISGELIPETGTFIFDSKKINFNNPKHAIKSGIIRIAQDYGLIPNLSIADNINLASPYFGNKIIYRRKSALNNAKNALAIINKEIDVDILVENANLALYPFISIAKALNQSPQILILDETTAILKNSDVHLLFEYIKKLKNLGKTIILVTHKIDEIFQVADEVIVLRNGKVALHSQTKTTNLNEIADAMVGEQFDILTQSIISNHTKQQSLLRIDNLNSKLISDISFTLNKSEVLGLISKSKEELNEIIYFIFGVKKQNGKIFKEGKQILINTPKKAIANKIGYISDDKKFSGLFNNMNVSDNINFLRLKYFSRFGFIKSNVLKKIVEKDIKMFDIQVESITQPINELSGGNQQKALFAKWLTSDFDLYILHEPTAGIDIKGKYDFYRLVNEYKQKGKSFLLVSSEWDEIKNICDRLLVIENGQIKASYDKNTFDEKEVYAHTF
jgi:ribose transport system ATP-binding protein